MKKIYFLLSFLLIVTGMRASIVHGTVLNQSSVAVVGQVVHIADTSNGIQLYAAQDTTNANGEYSFSIPGNVPSGSGMHVRTEKCGMVYSNVFVFQGVDAVSNFVVCGTTTTSAVSGTVKLGSATGNPAYPATVFLIKKSFDQTTGSYVLTLLDTTATNTNGEYQFTGITVGANDLLVKSALTTANPDYNNYLPTYKENALTWSAGLPANFTAGANNIHLVAGINPGGPGFIGGSVLQGANKTTNVGDPLPYKLILLTTINDAGVAYTYSDASGHFSFSNLAYGTYKLFGDAWGKSNQIDTIVISPSQSNVQVVFQENSTHNIPTGIPVCTTNELSVYPNPFNNSVSVSGLTSLSGNITIQLFNTAGACVLQQKLAANFNTLQLATGSLPSAVYFLEIKSDQGIQCFRILK